MEDYKSDPTWKYQNSIYIDAGIIWKKNDNLSKGEEVFFYLMMLDALKERQKIEDIYNF